MNRQLRRKRDQDQEIVYKKYVKKDIKKRINLSNKLTKCILCDLEIGKSQTVNQNLVDLLFICPFCQDSEKMFVDRLKHFGGFDIGKGVIAFQTSNTEAYEMIVEYTRALKEFNDFQDGDEIECHQI